MATLTEVQSSVKDPEILRLYNLVDNPNVESAEWGEYTEDRVRRDGSHYVFKKKVPVINGMIICMEMRENFKPLLELYPKVRVYLQMSDTERNEKQRNPSKQPAEWIQWNGVAFMIPKGKDILVPEPLVSIVENANEVIRIDSARSNAEILAPLEW